MASLKVDTGLTPRRNSVMGKRPSILSTGTGRPSSGRRASRSKGGSIQRSGSHDSVDSIDMKNSVYKVAATLLKRQRQRESEGLETTYERPPARFEPSYRTSPGYGQKFSQKRVREVVTEVIEKYMSKEEPYNSKNGKRLTLGLAEIIKDRVKDLEFPRYKLVVQVVIGELGEQGVEVASQMVGDQHTDNFCVVKLQDGKKNWFCTALIFGFYYE